MNLYEENFPEGTEVLYTNEDDGSVGVPGVVGPYIWGNMFIPIIVPEKYYVDEEGWFFGSAELPILALPRELMKV